MLGLLLPFNIETNTVAKELRDRPIYVNPSVITRLFVEDNQSLGNYDDVINLSHYLRNENSATRVNFTESDNLSVNSTWEEIFDEDFDVVSKLDLSNSIKVKVKIKSITKFTPKIVLD